MYTVRITRSKSGMLEARLQPSRWLKNPPFALSNQEFDNLPMTCQKWKYCIWNTTKSCTEGICSTSLGSMHMYESEIILQIKVFFFLQIRLFCLPRDRSIHYNLCFVQSDAKIYQYWTAKQRDILLNTNFCMLTYRKIDTYNGEIPSNRAVAV